MNIVADGEARANYLADRVGAPVIEGVRDAAARLELTPLMRVGWHSAAAELAAERGEVADAFSHAVAAFLAAREAGPDARDVTWRAVDSALDSAVGLL